MIVLDGWIAGRSAAGVMTVQDATAPATQTKVYPYAIAHRLSPIARKAALAMVRLGQDPLRTALIVDHIDTCPKTVSTLPAWSEVYAITGSKPFADDAAFFTRDYDDGKITDLATALGLGDPA